MGRMRYHKCPKCGKHGRYKPNDVNMCLSCKRERKDRIQLKKDNKKTKN